jgi:hypothetical protein
MLPTVLDSPARPTHRRTNLPRSGRPVGFCALPSVADEVSYGWGMIPVSARIGGTNWTSSLFSKDRGYIVPMKDKVRTAEGVPTGIPSPSS